MAQTSTNVSILKASSLKVQTKFNSDLGKDITWHLIDAKFASLNPDALNTRFAPDEALTDEEQEQAVIEEDGIAFENLQKSWENNPQFEQLIGFAPDESSKITVACGNRRYFAAKRTKAESVLIWVAYGLSKEEIEHIRDWPEINVSKVVHTPYAKYKAIYKDLQGRNEIDRERRINFWKQKGYTKAQILKAERVFGRMHAFCDANGEKTLNRAGQVKAFEAYDQICESKFQELRDQGELQRVVTLDKVAKAFLKNQIAHDDLKVTIEGLAELPAADPVYKAVQENPEYLNDVQNLRRLTNLARTQRETDDLSTETREFTARIFAKLIDRADAAEMANCLSELKDTVVRLEAALANINGGVQ